MSKRIKPKKTSGSELRQGSGTAAQPATDTLGQGPDRAGAPVPCTLCGGAIGPDITGRPMCYGCGPFEMLPYEERERRQDPAHPPFTSTVVVAVTGPHGEWLVRCPTCGNEVDLRTSEQDRPAGVCKVDGTKVA